MTIVGGILCGFGVAAIVWAMFTRSRKRDAVDTVSEAIGRIEQAEILRMSAMSGEKKSAIKLAAAINRAEEAHKYLHKNSAKIKRESNEETLRRLARLGY